MVVRPSDEPPTGRLAEPGRADQDEVNGFRVRALWRTHEKMRFLIVGGWNTLFGYLCFIVLYAWLHEHLHYLLIGLAAHAIAMINAFVAHRIFVFRSREPWFGEFLRFNVSLLFVLGYGIGALWLLVAVFHLDPVIAQGIVTLGAVIISYVVHRRFSFGLR